MEQTGTKDDILILTNNLTSGAIPHLIADIAPELDEYQLHVGVTLGGKAGRVSESIVWELEEHGVNILQFHFDTKPFPVAAMELYIYLDRIDLLQTHLAYSGIVGRLIGSVADVPVVSTEHRIHNWQEQRNQIINGFTLPLADSITTVSEQVLRSFNPLEKVLLYCTDEAVIHNSVKPSFLDTPSQADSTTVRTILNTVATDGPLITSVGRMTREKNHRVLVKCLPTILSELPNTNLVIVGDGALKDDLIVLAEEEGVSDSLYITGWVDRDDVGRILGQSDIFVMPSRQEGMGIALVEAMFAGLPLVLSDIPVFREVAGETAVYASVDDHTDWARSILHICENDTSGMSVKAEKRARSLFSPESVADDYRREYENLL